MEPRSRGLRLILTWSPRDPYGRACRRGANSVPAKTGRAGTGRQ